MSPTAIIRTLSPINLFLQPSLLSLPSRRLSRTVSNTRNRWEFGNKPLLSLHAVPTANVSTHPIPYIKQRCFWISTSLAMPTGWDWNADLNLLIINFLYYSLVPTWIMLFIYVYCIYITNLIDSEQTIYRDPSVCSKISTNEYRRTQIMERSINCDVYINLKSLFSYISL
jgi:hypothetical protein